MERCDPADAPISDVWLARDDGERIDLVERFHRDQESPTPNLPAHAAFHVAVENELARIKATASKMCEFHVTPSLGRGLSCNLCPI